MSTKGKWLTIEQKCEVIAQHRREPSTNYTQLSQWTKTRFELSVPPTRQTIRNIIQSAAIIEAKRLCVHVTAKGRDPCVRSRELEDQLTQYINTCREHNVRLTRRLLNTKAREILNRMDNAPTHNLSVGWLTRFMKRHGLNFQKEREELKETSMAAAVPAHAGSTVVVDVVEPHGLETDPERVRVDKLRQKATKRLWELEQEARELKKYLRRLNAASNAHLHR
ncbi:unnamed protein product [Peronospora farinosa]|uniref:HTH CENPB-type domain-containing protein n=1 Tax=Peronospora farinosa TaxID=134698 RepID=A0ABN8C8X3_9STRA|nr:unnamed protein product [Peronospora farinosa]